MSEVDGSVEEDLAFSVRVRKDDRRGWGRPQWVKAEDATRAEKLAERLMRVIKEFSENTRFKANIDIRYCKPSICGVETWVFYDIMLEDKESRDEVATITFRWNVTGNKKSFIFVIADTEITRLEDTLNILHLATELAKEFYAK